MTQPLSPSLSLPLSCSTRCIFRGRSLTFFFTPIARESTPTPTSRPFRVHFGFTRIFKSDSIAARQSPRDYSGFAMRCGDLCVVSPRCRCHCGGQWSSAILTAIQQRFDQIPLVIFDDLFSGIITSNSRVTREDLSNHASGCIGLGLIAFAVYSFAFEGMSLPRTRAFSSTKIDTCRLSAAWDGHYPASNATIANTAD